MSVKKYSRVKRSKQQQEEHSKTIKNSLIHCSVGVVVRELFEFLRNLH